jgi:acetolactate synthase I/II/III large subunit
MLNAGELGTAVQEKLDMTVLLMNDDGYGVIRNIQDAEYGARRGFVDLFNPDFAGFAASYGVGYRRLSDPAGAQAALGWAFGRSGVSIIEVDMATFGGFGINFAGPPRKP